MKNLKKIIMTGEIVIVIIIIMIGEIIIIVIIKYLKVHGDQVSKNQVLILGEMNNLKMMILGVQVKKKNLKKLKLIILGEVINLNNNNNNLEEIGEIPKIINKNLKLQDGVHLNLKALKNNLKLLLGENLKIMKNKTNQVIIMTGDLQLTIQVVVGEPVIIIIKNQVQLNKEVVGEPNPMMQEVLGEIQQLIIMHKKVKVVEAGELLLNQQVAGVTQIPQTIIPEEAVEAGELPPKQQVAGVIHLLIIIILKKVEVEVGVILQITVINNGDKVQILNPNKKKKDVGNL